jgi:hypothetical protein
MGKVEVEDDEEDMDMEDAEMGDVEMEDEIREQTEEQEQTSAYLAGEMERMELDG